MTGDKVNLRFDVKTENDLQVQGYDGIIWVTNAPLENQRIHTGLASAFRAAAAYDATVGEALCVLPLADLPAGRAVVSPTGPIDPDYDDLRSFKEAAARGVQKALKVGIQRPLLYLEEHSNHPNADLITLLGALEELHVPIQVRELKPTNVKTIQTLGISHSNPGKLESLVKLALSLETGRIAARDIGDGDPERMAPAKVREYVESLLKDTCIKITVVDDEEMIKKEYPLFEAVNRCASTVQRHKGCIMYLQYSSPDQSAVKENLFLVGKGVTYDTGGADIKAGGVMAGMSRDKCGAAAVAGFMKVVANLQPKHVNVVGALSLVRNSVGSNCYVADELIKARSGALVRVGNTDAEGRMIMADVLCRMKELAVNCINPQLFTIATLTGHACLAVGEGYSIVLDNGPARRDNVAFRLVKSGAEMADPFEVSSIRREDFKAHRGTSKGDDVMQSNNLPSSRTERGHQRPAAFLILASGLDMHGSGNDKPLKYSHLDIAASGGSFPEPATGAPILALAKAYLF